MRSIHGFTLALCLAATPAFAHADDATHRAKAEQMLQLTKTDTIMETQLANLQTRVNEMAKQQTGTAALTPEQAKLTDAYLKQVQDITADEVGWAKLRPAIIQFYSDSFTDADLDGIIAFYKTPAGQALLTKSPDLGNKTMTTVQDRIKEMQPKLASITQDYAAKMKAVGPPPPAAGAPAPAPALNAPAAAPAPAPAPKPALK